MRLLKMFFVLMIAAMAIGLSSCAKEEVSPPVVDGGASEMIYANASGEREDDPDEDCRCYMSITGVSNTGGQNLIWEFEDVTLGNTPPIFKYEGISGFYASGAGYSPLPTPYSPLDYPTGGTHELVMTFFAGASYPDFTIHATVKCYRVNDDGSETLATTTFHSFKWSNGTPDPSDLSKRSFLRFFSCLSEIGL
jgi:hypothetical protein